MSQDAINRAARKARRARRVGSDARCARCGWGETEALSRRGEEIICYECLCQEKGKAIVEQHHLLGKGNDLATIGVLGNLHRALSDRQYDWPDAVRTNANRDPLLWLAGLTCTLRDLFRWLVDHCDGVVAFLVALAGEMQKRFGSAWWHELGLAALWAEVSA